MQKVGVFMVIGIIGAGASGMAAAIRAAGSSENRILLFERQARVGRKLSATGNGRCNLSNIHAQEDLHYHGEKPEFGAVALSRFPVSDTLSWFRSLGLFTTIEDSGKVYPFSDQANSVVDVLRFALQKPNISFIAPFEVQKIIKDKDGFLIKGEEIYHVDKVIIACGGLAGSKLGGSMSGYQLLRSFGHKMTRLRPSLVQIKSSWNANASLKGVRAICNAKILRNGSLFAESSGEIQFTDYGISGPVIFEISRDVCEGIGPWECVLDFLPNYTEQEIMDTITRKKDTELTCEDLLTGLIHNRLGRTICQSAGLNLHSPVRSVTTEQLREVTSLLKSFSISLSETMGMESAQVTAGGMKTEEFDPETMESKLVPGLYACGEVLDVDGDCGGYNLQWAWSSGSLAGVSAGKVKV